MLTLRYTSTLPSSDTLYIEADNIREIADAIAFVKSLGAGADTPAPIQPDKPAPEPVQAEKPGPLQSPKPKKPEQPKQDAAIADAGVGDATALAQPTKEEQVAAPSVSSDDVADALTNLANERDIMTAKALLKRFGVQRLAELPQAKYAEFLAACKEAAASVEDEL